MITTMLLELAFIFSVCVFSDYIGSYHKWENTLLFLWITTLGVGVHVLYGVAKLMLGQG